MPLLFGNFLSCIMLETSCTFSLLVMLLITDYVIFCAILLVYFSDFGLLIFNFSEFCTTLRNFSYFFYYQLWTFHCPFQICDYFSRFLLIFFSFRTTLHTFFLFFSFWTIFHTFFLFQISNFLVSFSDFVKFNIQFFPDLHNFQVFTFAQ